MTRLEIKADEDGNVRIIAHEELCDHESAGAVQTMAAMKIPHAHVEVERVTVSERTPTK